MPELLWQQKGLPGVQGGWEWNKMWLALTSAETFTKVYFQPKDASRLLGSLRGGSGFPPAALAFGGEVSKPNTVPVG